EEIAFVHHDRRCSKRLGFLTYNLLSSSTHSNDDCFSSLHLYLLVFNIISEFTIEMIMGQVISSTIQPALNTRRARNVRQRQSVNVIDHCLELLRYEHIIRIGDM
ncbi:4844_t:CDS:2, partial [Dentiscutata heterogama]